MNDALEYINSHGSRGAAIREEFFRLNAESIRAAALETAARISQGGKLLICGNGGSAADAQHIAGEFVNRFLLDRPGLPAIALTTDTSILTAIGNDLGYDQVFSRQVEALGNEGDVLLAISTSGNSPNVLAALEAARKKGLFTIGLSGPGGGRMVCDLLIAVPGGDTPLIQEIQLAAEHVFCAVTDHYLFENPGAIASFLRDAQGKDA